MGNLPISTVIPVSTTVLPVVDGVPTLEHGDQGGSETKKERTPTQPGVSDGKPDVSSSTFTVVTVPTTIHTIMNGVSAQILTVVPVTSAVGVGNNVDSAPAPSSTADADPHAGSAQQAAAETGKSGAGNKSLSSTHETSQPHAAPAVASFDANAWQSTEPSRSGLTSKPILPANNTPATASTSSRPPVVTAGAPGLVGSDGTRVAFVVFALAALLQDLCFSLVVILLRDTFCTSLLIFLFFSCLPRDDHVLSVLSYSFKMDCRSNHRSQTGMCWVVENDKDLNTQLHLRQIFHSVTFIS
ncbi:hypothetical protein FJTKL_12828 [Diaporthe vaccinii]|uniref:Uncharacterized protein n=1 Tax=Diaporthe vaccinii TaxID=105482 RepID=A0ABR4F9Q1_9PEZI